jgi:hypothetical protein
VEGRNSGIDIVQCIGRALRLLEGKTMAKIIIPVMEEDVEKSKFRDLIKVVKNLGEYDYQVKDILLGKNKNRNLIKVGCYKGDNKKNEIMNNINLGDLSGKINSCVIGGTYNWYKMYDEVVEFIEENDRRPIEYSKNTEEKKLGSWISRQSTSYKYNTKAMKDKDKREKWKNFNDKYKEYMLNWGDIWYKTYDNLVKFIKNNKKRPNNNSKNIEEQKLGRWIIVQNANYKKNIQSMKNEDIREKWKEINDKYKEYIMNFNEIWYKTYNNAIKFIENNNKRPNCYSKNIEEQKLGSWINLQNVNYKKNTQSMKEEDKRRKWKDFNKKYKEYMMNNDQIWYSEFNNAKNFIETNKIKPNMCSKNTDEQNIGKWFNRQCINYKKNSQSMKEEDKRQKWEEFNKKYKEYMMNKDEIWYAIYNDTIKFMKENNKKPNIYSKNNIEKKLGNWISIQNKNYNKKIEAMKDEDKRIKWEELINKYKTHMLNSSEKWYKIYSEVMQFIKNNNKKPSCNSKNKIEKKLGTWIFTQNKNYKKNIKSMQDIEKKKKWEVFNKKYL